MTWKDNGLPRSTSEWVNLYKLSSQLKRAFVSILSALATKALALYVNVVKLCDMWSFGNGSVVSNILIKYKIELFVS